MKKFLLPLVVALISLASCTDYTDDFNTINNRLDALEQSVPTIEEQISAIKTSIEVLEEVDTQLKESIKALEESDKATAEEITALKDADKAIEAKIEELKKYVDDAINSTKDWVNATFATLEQLNALSSEVAALKSLVDANKAEAAANLATAIANLDTSLKAWVGEQLSNYYTIAEIDAKIVNLEKAIADGDKALQQQLNDLKTQLESAKKELTEAYKKAIEKAVTENNGVIDMKIANEIAAVNKRIDEEVAAINDKMATLQAQVDKNTENITKLLARIQSVSYIPEYADGKVVVTRMGSTSWGELSFRISPKDAVVELEKIWQSALSCEAYYPKTRAVSLVKLAVTEYVADAESGVITVKISGEGLSDEFFAGTQEAKVALVISDGNNQVISEYADMVGKEITNEIWYTSTDGAVVEPNKTDVFGANIVSNTYENGRGVITFDDEVSQIGGSAFSSCDSLKSITIPNSVTSIGDGAFAGCHYLTGFTIPHSVQSIGYSCFAFCRSLSTFSGKYASEDGKCLVKDGELLSVSHTISETYSLPNNVTKIGYNCITGTSNKVEIVIPDSVVELHDESDKWVITAAQNISAFKGVFASADGTALIKDDALYGAALYGLSSYKIPEGIKTIKANLFQNSKLNAIIIPESITHIEKWAFNSCSKLRYIYCKATTPPTLGANIFEDLKAYPTIYVPAESVDSYKTAKRWSVFADKILPFEEGMNVITYTSTDGNIITPYSGTANNFRTIESLFNANMISNTYENGVGKMVFDGVVVIIGEYAFLSCTTLKSIVIPNGVIAVGSSAFYKCSKMEEITLNNGLKTIYGNAFHFCHALKSLTIPDSVNDIREIVFFNCEKLKYIYGKFSTADNMSVVVNKKLIWVSTNYPAGDYIIPDGVTHICNYVIGYPHNVISVTIPESVETFSDSPFIGVNKISAFYGKYTTVDHRAVIKDNKLYGVATYGITEYTVPDGVKEIAPRMLRVCGLTTIYLPASLEKVGSNQFEDARTLKYIYCKAIVPPTTNAELFLDAAKVEKIYVPRNSVEAYKAAVGWKTKADKIVGYDF